MYSNNNPCNAAKYFHIHLNSRLRRFYTARGCINLTAEVFSFVFNFKFIYKTKKIVTEATMQNHLVMFVKYDIVFIVAAFD